MKKFLELAIRAGLVHREGDIFDKTYLRYEERHFAELIVQECLKLVDQHFVGAVGTMPGAHNSAVKRCHDSIVNEFDLA